VQWPTSPTRAIAIVIAIVIGTRHCRIITVALSHQQ
jgi:hypothetical protein